MAAIDFKVRNVKSPEGAAAAVAEVTGSIDATTINQFQTIMDKLVQKGVKNLMLDCTNIKYINSTGLGTLLKYVDTFSGVGGNLVFIRVPSKVMLVMEMLGFNALFNIYEEEDDALQFLGASGAVEEAPAEAVAPEMPSLQTPVPGPAPVSPIAPAPAPVAAAPPAAVPARKVSFPLEAECSRCGQKLEIPGEGTFRCPRCAQMCAVNGSGSVEFPATRLPAPVEVSVPATAGFAGVVAALAEGLAITIGLNSDKSQQIREDIGGIISAMVENSYSGDATSAINILLMPSETGLRSEIVDNGSGTDLSSMQTGADDVRVTPHPVKGSVYALLYNK
ncbi:MAG: STAS domain-containing protein [Planctomycetes bacterium]|nr:STAS domain-containing protein [Planctomycetota bacterium]